jgi:hypothetical protein
MVDSIGLGENRRTLVVQLGVQNRAEHRLELERHRFPLGLDFSS